mmetsp:Transcript_3040/g.5229  ORF Transcript_3040/g.5229 Transcript_3040/m.5229 type:complete len:574 (+) Transcript_3040:92-1813(+)
MNASDAWSDIDLSGPGEDQLLNQAAAHIRHRSASMPPARHLPGPLDDSGDGRAKRLARPKTMAIFRRQLAVQHELGLNRSSPSSRRGGLGMMASQLSTSCSDNTDVESEFSESTPLLVYVLTGMAGIGGFLFGYDTGIVSGAMPKVAKTFGIQRDPFEQELIVSATVLFAIAGALMGDLVSETYGRKTAILAASAIFTAGALMVAAARTVSFMVFGRSVLGIAVGLASQSVPMYLAEIAPPHLRGGLVSFFTASITFGQVVACITAGLLSEAPNGWRWMMGLAAAPAVVQLIGMIFLPESPRWLAEQRRSSEAFRVLLSVRQSEKAASMELDSIAEEIRSLQAVKDSELDKQAQLAFHRALPLGCGLMMLQQFCGINTVMYYSASIFKMAGSSDTMAIWLTVLPALANASMSSTAATLVDYCGRRSMILFSLSTVALSLLALSASFHYRELLSPEHASLLIICSMMAYVLSFATGLSSGPWVVNAEIYSLRYRSLGLSLATVTNWTCNFIVSMSFLSLCNWLDTGSGKGEQPNPAAAFLVYAAVAELGFMFIYYHLPETSGINLEDIQKVFGV